MTWWWRFANATCPLGFIVVSVDLWRLLLATRAVALAQTDASAALGVARGLAGRTAAMHNLAAELSLRLQCMRCALQDEHLVGTFNVDFGPTALSTMCQIVRREFPSQGTTKMSFQLEDEPSHLFSIFFLRGFLIDWCELRSNFDIQDAFTSFTSREIVDSFFPPHGTVSPICFRLTNCCWHSSTAILVKTQLPKSIELHDQRSKKRVRKVEHHHKRNTDFEAKNL